MLEAVRTFQPMLVFLIQKRNSISIHFNCSKFDENLSLKMKPGGSHKRVFGFGCVKTTDFGVGGYRSLLIQSAS
jgi:hypothetical protein